MEVEAVDRIPKPDQVVAAASNVAQKVLYGGLADLRPMPRTLIDEGELHVQAEKWQQPLVGEEYDTQHGLSQAELGGCLCDCCHERKREG